MAWRDSPNSFRPLLEHPATSDRKPACGSVGREPAVGRTRAGAARRGVRLGRTWSAGLVAAALAAALTAVTLGRAAASDSSAVAEAARRVVQSSGLSGGLVVHLGCTDGRLTAALRVGPSYVVQGLAATDRQLATARRYVQSVGLYGPVSVRRLQGRRLPYVDNLVNLLVITADGWKVDDPEVARVLAPGGVAVSLDAQFSPVRRYRKPRPDRLDEWTHYLHGPDNNPVSTDQVVGPLEHFQWIAPPRFSRSHDHLASVSMVVSSGGRVFYVADFGSIAFAAASPRWRLVARDAFSGVLLWEREIPRWEYHLRDFRSGPADLARRLVAVGDRLYVTLGLDAPVSQLDAATGKTLQTYEGTEGTQEILYVDGTLYLVAGRRQTDWDAQRAREIVSQPGYRPPFQRYTPPVYDKRLVVVDAQSGRTRWTKHDADTKTILPTTLAVSDGRLYFQNADAVVCLDAATGQVVWRVPRPVQRIRLAWSTPTLVVQDGVVLSADRNAVDKRGELLWIPSGGYHQYIRDPNVEGQLLALDAETGQRLWSCSVHEGFNAPVDVLVIDGLVWTGRIAEGRDPGFTEARDLHTGEVRRRRPPDQQFMKGGGHARCHRTYATTRYILMDRRGVEFVDVQNGGVVANRWVRGICQYGFTPANGLLYIPPHSCACSVSDLLKCGFLAFAPGRDADRPGQRRSASTPTGSRSTGGPAASNTAAKKKGKPQTIHEVPVAELASRLQRGPAFGEAALGTSPQRSANPTADWPTYRHDARRSGATSVRVPLHRLQPAWKTKLGRSLTAPVVADGVLLVADKNTHTVWALDAATGKRLWSFTAGARVDSPPTVADGRVVFGSADGCVYCLRLSDGQLVWRFQAAPADRQIVSYDQLESVWPVPGNVLVVDGAAYFVAGRTSYAEGGLLLYKLDVATGQVLRCQRLEVPKAVRDRGVVSGGYLPDVLSSDGRSLFLRQARFDLELNRQPDDVPHLWSSVGFLDASWWHRTYWQFGTRMLSGWGGWPKVGLRVPAGRLLVTDGRRIFGYGRNQYDIPGGHVGVDGETAWGPVGRGLSRWTYYRLFGRPLQTRTDRQARRSAQPPSTWSGWTRRVPVLVLGMALADDTLLLAGPDDPVRQVPHDPSEVDPLAEAFESQRGGHLLAVSADDGKTQLELPLESPPVFDGLAVAHGRVYLSTKAGDVVCLAGQSQ